LFRCPMCNFFDQLGNCCIISYTVFALIPRRSRLIFDQAVLLWHSFAAVDTAMLLTTFCVPWAVRDCKVSHRVGVCGGDDGTRTRDLCRDRAAF
jgi:hypothetical protein